MLLLGAALACILLAAQASAAGEVELVRVYQTDTKGEVFEVCRGNFDPPVTDPSNPSYCKGQVERWSAERWQRYNKRTPASGREGAAEYGGKPPGRDPEQPSVVVGGTRSGAAAAVPLGGSLDPTSVLGIENPLCGLRKELSVAQARNCLASRSPEASYPVGNYGWDIHIEAGGFITSLLAPYMSFVLQLFSVLWLLLLLALKGCLIVLGLAFSLSPFTDNHSLGQISKGLESFYGGLTSPWLATLFVILGAWGLYNGIVRQRSGETIGGMLAAVVMMLGAMWIIHSPGETIGTASDIVNKTALVAVSAPSSGRLSAPLRSYDDAAARVWDEMTAVPFCAMNFSDVQWCMKAKPSKGALEAAKSGISDGDVFTQQILGQLPDGFQVASNTIQQRMSGLFGPAPTIRDLYLRYSPGSGPRDALWKYFNGEGDSHIGLPLGVGPQINVGGGSEGAAPDKVSMQGRNGGLTRMVLVLIFVLGLLGGLLLLLWLAMKMVMAAAATFILVLAAPVVMFFPVFGQAGRTAFIRWATSLLGAIVSKLTFSALLGIVLLGSSVLGSSIGGNSPTLGLIATMAFWWAAFLGRDHYLTLLQIDPAPHRDFGLSRAIAGGYLGYRVASAAKSSIKRGRAERGEARQFGERRHVQAVAETADRDLGALAEQRLDVAVESAKGRSARFGYLSERIKGLRADPDIKRFRANPSSLGAEARPEVESAAARLSLLETEAARLGPQARIDRQRLDRVGANQTAGLPRYSRAEVEGAKAEIARESSLPITAPEHRWRAEAEGADPDKGAGLRVIAEGLEKTQRDVASVSSQRLDQLKVHRPGRARDRAVHGHRGDRRPGGPQPPPPGAGPPSGGDPTGSARARRSARGRDGMSR